MIEYTFEQLIDVDQVRQLLESHHRLSGMAYGLFDNNENDIVSAGWQEICTRFHRAHPVCSARCRESNAFIKSHLHDLEDDFLEYRCGNGMIDVAMPIVIEGRHLSTFFIGQFFYDDDRPDRAFFLDQAREFGFDPDGYLAALERVPVFSRGYVRDNLVFLHGMVRVLAVSGMKSLRLAEEKEQRRLFKERYALFGFALDQVREAAFLIDENGRFHYVNQDACRSLGYARDELLGMAIPDIDPDYSDEMLIKSIERLIDVGSHTFETRHRTRDGRIFPVEITSTLFEHNGVRYILSLARDISGRRRAEQELRASRDYLENIINAIADPVFVKDELHRLVLVNDAECVLAGCPREELLGKTDYDFFPKEQVDLFWRIDDQVLTSGEPNVNEELITDAAGETRTIVTHKSRYVDPHGNRFVVGVIRDITERKRMELQLRQALDFSEGIINAIPDLLFEVDRNGRYLNVWAQKPELLAAQKEVLLGKTVRDVLSPEGAAIVMNGLREAEEQGLSFGKTLQIDLQQDPHWFELSVSRKPGSDHSDVRFLVLSRDISERKRMEAELTESEARYRHSSNLLKSILESATVVGVYALDREYRYLAFNQRHRQGVNYLWGGDIAVGMSLLDAVDSNEYREKIRKVFDDVLTGRSFSVESRFKVVKDGREVIDYIENYGSPVFNDDGEVVGLTVFTINITERKRMEEAILSLNETLESRLVALTQPVGDVSNLRLSDLFNIDELQEIQDAFAQVTGVASLITDTQGQPITKPSNFCHLCEHVIRKTEKGLLNCCRSDALLGQKHSKGAILQRCFSGGLWDAGTSICVGDQHIANWLVGQILDESADEEAMLAYAGEIGVDEEVFRNALTHVTRMSLQQFEKIADAVYLIANQLSKLAMQNVQQARFITERKRAEEALAVREQQFRTLTENSPNIIIRYDLECRRVYVNPAYAREIGIPVDQVYNSDPAEQWNDSMSISAEEYTLKLRQVMVTGTPTEMLVEWKRHDSGLKNIHTFTVVAERNPDGQVAGCLAIGHNITEYKQAAEKLLAKREQLAAMSVELSMAEERERRRIASDLHDHIGQNLLLSRIKLGTMATTFTDSSDEDTCNEIKGLLTQAISDVRSLTQQLNPPLLASVGLEAALEWLAKRIEADYSLRVDFVDDGRTKPLSEELRAVVFQSARELLINVAKHAKTSEARLTIGRKADMFMLTIVDQGVGFACLPDPGTNMMPDCSFGLFNIRQRIKHLGGELTIESAPGCGARATIRVPLTDG